MVEVGKKYRLIHWTPNEWILVKFIGKSYLIADLQDGREYYFRVDNDWIEIKQRPKTLADCAKEGDFTPKMVTLDPCPDVFVRIASPGSNFAWHVSKDGKPLEKRVEKLEECKIWPVVLIDE